MDVKTLEPLLRNATIKALDGVARKVSKSESAAKNALMRLITRWNDLDPAEKDHVASIVIATATTAVTAIAALRGRKKSPLKKASQKIAKAVKKMA